MVSNNELNWHETTRGSPMVEAVMHIDGILNNKLKKVNAE